MNKLRRGNGDAPGFGKLEGEGAFFAHDGGRNRKRMRLWLGVLRRAPATRRGLGGVGRFCPKVDAAWLIGALWRLVVGVDDVHKGDVLG